MTSLEDDATELQFPKGMDIDCWSSENSLNDFHSEGRCSVCDIMLELPYIECIICSAASLQNDELVVRICLKCFAKGREVGHHKSDHAYVIKKMNFPVFPTVWQAKEEILLLNSIMDCGIGNWYDISRRVGSKSPDECKKHYVECYIDCPVEELNSIFPASFFKQSGFIPRPIPYITGNEDPPRPAVGSAAFRDLAGYNAARSDFVIEQSNDAEMILGDLDLTLFEEDEEPSLGRELQSSLIDIYQQILKERQRRKAIIKEHGLINLHQSNVKLNYYRAHFSELSDVFPKLYSLVTNEDIQYFVESFRLQVELKKRIGELKEFRDNGLIKHSQTCVFNASKIRRENNLKRKHKLKFGPEGTETNIEDVQKLKILTSVVPLSLKRLSIPLNISQEPDYHSLNEEEKSLASSLRILPKNFNYMKTVMVTECRKANGLKLCDARQLFKIDVNKIRKMYDFFIKEGLIYSQ